ncbi:hypothetical protein FKM82_017944 [Ascaphus truei]
MGGVSGGVLFRAYDVQHGVVGQVLHRLGLHPKSIQAIGGIELVGLPRSAVIQRFLQDHFLRSAGLEDNADVVGQLNGLVPGQRDVDL